MTEIFMDCLQIQPGSPEFRNAAKKHFDLLIKPVGSLAKLEDMVCLFAAVTGKVSPVALDYPRKAIVLVSDGTEEPFLLRCRNGEEALNSFAAAAGSALKTVFIDKSARQTTEEFLRFGFAEGKRIIEAEDYYLLGIGLPGSYICPKDCVQLSAGTAGDILLACNEPRIAALTGIILAAAAKGRVIMLDGLASCVAALAAIKLNSAVKDYLVASGVTTEDGQRELLACLGVSPVLNLAFTQGQGENAALAFRLFDAGVRAYREMETFGTGGVHAELEEFAVDRN